MLQFSFMSKETVSFGEIVDDFQEDDQDEINSIENGKSKLLRRLDEEIELTKKNRANLEAQWIQILRREKGDELKKEFKILLQHHEKEIEQKNKIIRTLYSSFDLGEDQYQIALAAHLTNINALIDMYDGRLLSMENNFFAHLETTVAQNESEREKIREHQCDSKQKVNVAIDKKEKEGLESEANERRDHQHLLQEIHNRNLEEINGLRVVLESKIEDLDEQFESSHGEYVHNTDSTSSKYQQLAFRDKETRLQIEIKTRDIERVQSNLQQLRFRCNKNSTDTKKKYQFILKQKSIVLNRYQILKAKMNRFRELQQKELTELSMNANTKKKVLKEQQETAKRILKLSYLNAKMENDHERVMSFIVDPSDKEIEDQAERMMRTFRDRTNELVSYSRDKGIHVESYFASFWKKYNNVLLDALSLEQNENKLIKEHGQLKVIIFFLRFLKCII